MDVATGRSRGTGFACFWNKEDADKAIEQSNILRAETVGNEPAVVVRHLEFQVISESSLERSRRRRTHSSSRPSLRPIRQHPSPETLSCTAALSTLAAPSLETRRANSRRPASVSARRQISATSTSCAKAVRHLSSLTWHLYSLLTTSPLP